MSTNPGLRAEAAEQNLIGACLVSPQIAPVVCASVSSDDMADPDARVIFAAIGRLVARGAPVVLSQLAGEVDRRLLGVALTWASAVASPIFAPYDAQSVLANSLLRQITRHLQQMTVDATRRLPPASDAIQRLDELTARYQEVVADLPFVIPAGEPTVAVRGPVLAAGASVARQWAVPRP